MIGGPTWYWVWRKIDCLRAFGVRQSDDWIDAGYCLDRRVSAYNGGEPC